MHVPCPSKWIIGQWKKNDYIINRHAFSSMDRNKFIVMKVQLPSSNQWSVKKENDKKKQHPHILSFFRNIDESSSMNDCGQAVSFFNSRRMVQLMMALRCEQIEISNVITCKKSQKMKNKHLYSLSGERRRNSWKSTKLILMLMTSVRFTRD